jgi:hypothetical protein
MKHQNGGSEREPPFSRNEEPCYFAIDTVGRPLGASSTDFSTSRHWNFLPLCRTQ